MISSLFEQSLSLKREILKKEKILQNITVAQLEKINNCATMTTIHPAVYCCKHKYYSNAIAEFVNTSDNDKIMRKAQFLFFLSLLS